MPLSRLGGNHALKELLRPRLAQGKLGHAYIVAGAEGSGKHTLASILSQAMVCSAAGAKPCGSCPACKKALAGIHPDIITVLPEQDKAAISVDQVRQMRADAYIRPNEASRKVYILEGCDRLRGEAQNAMLKLLEEGPAYAAFLLLAENQGNLLITVRSRCETLMLAEPEQEFSHQEQEQTAQLARELMDLWLAGDEAALMARCARLEQKKDAMTQQQFAVLTQSMSDYLHRLLPTAPDQRKVIGGIQLMEEFRQHLAQNVNRFYLLGRLCAVCTQEAYSLEDF